MQRRSFLPLVLAILAALTATSRLDAAEGKIRVLLLTGGHAFEQQPFYAMFDGMANVQYTKAEMPKDAGLLKPGLEKQYDVVAMYDMTGKITPEQQAAFVDLLKTGIGVVALHHNLGAHRDWPEYTQIIGGKFIFKDGDVHGGKEFKKSTWAHDQDIPVTVVDKAHPITQGVADFTIHDETYGGFYVADNVHVLLTTNHPKNTPQIAWVTKYGKSPVAFIMLGHDGKAYANPNYVKLVQQAIAWAAKR